ncbi:MAG: ion transporter [Trueperaceae bacterium]|nr:ion transporter [Trueperaceae bacterium]
MPTRERIGRVIFGTDTPAGRAFDVILLWAIVVSVVAVVLESVPSIRATYGAELVVAEWAFTVAFTVEYAFRLATARRPRRYASSFYGAIDLLAVLPSYLGLLFGGAPLLVVLRALRLLRVFRVLKLTRYLGEAGVLSRALGASRVKITVFLTFVLTVVLVVGSFMYVVEGPTSGFESIPVSVYWAIVTLTTVGYGDITPLTPLGRTLAAALMILGYAVIAVPTGIVTTELVRAGEARDGTTVRETPGRAAPRRECMACGLVGHGSDAGFCRRCGAALDQSEASETE